MNVLVVASTFPRFEGDSVPPFIYNLSRELTNYFDVFALAPYSPKSVKTELMEGVHVERFQYWFGGWRTLADRAILPHLKKRPWLAAQLPSFLISELYNIQRMVSKHDIKTVLAPWVIPQGFLTALYKKCFNSEIDFVTVGLGGDVYSLKALNPLRRFTVNHAKQFTVLSQDMKRYCEDNELGHPQFLPMGTDFDKFHPSKYDPAIRNKYGSGGPILLFVGRLSEKKGLRYLVEAMPMILAKKPSSKLLIIGEGELKEDLQSRIERLGLENSISLLGGKSHKELPEYYATADLFISPSIVTSEGDREGSPLTITEAMASECPVLTTNIETLKTLVDDGETGLMVDQRDPESLAEAAIHMLERSSLRQRLAEKAREDCRKTFSLEIIGRRYANLLTKDDQD